MVDRASAKSRADVYRRCAEKMEEGNSIAIFPEGGVPDDTSIIPMILRTVHLCCLQNIILL